MRRIAADLGLQLPASPDFPAVATAIVIVGLTALAAWAIGRFAGPRLAEYWQRKAAPQAGTLAPRLCAILRYFILWLVLAIVLRAHAWPETHDNEQGGERIRDYVYAWWRPREQHQTDHDDGRRWPAARGYELYIRRPGANGAG